jgi:hydroxymethylpyrimidine pyrophosphatase-like HAD family hydrolase
MRYHALVADYDGTLASNDRISDETARGLERLRASGRRNILLTGRRLDDLLAVCSCARLFDVVVAENGGIVYDPATREETRLAPPPSKWLLRGLQARGVTPLEIGQVVVGTGAAHRSMVQDLIWELGLEAQVIANRGAVMVLPASINKATGLRHALRKLGLTRHEVVGIGDAENDHSFLQLCECAVCVANALPSLKETVAHVTRAQNGEGVIELIEQLIRDDLRDLEHSLRQHFIALGVMSDNLPVQLAPYGDSLLVAGPSGCGKSTFTAGIVERLLEKEYQVCIIDPEGDYGTLREVIALGNHLRAPGISEALAILEDPTINLSINLLGIPLEDRPQFITQLLPNIQAMRSRVGRPHWIILDEAHHMLPHTWSLAGSALPQTIGEIIVVTVHPEHIAPAVLAPIGIVIAIGNSPQETLRGFSQAAGKTLSWPEDVMYQADRVVAWFVNDCPPFSMRPIPGRAERIRHHRKYAEGDLRWHSFYFRGPGSKHNLKAQNLAIFCQIAEGIDEATWMFHLHRGDYSRWFRDAVRDDVLANEAKRIEQRTDTSPYQTRQMLVELVRSRYTLPE